MVGGGFSLKQPFCASCFRKHPSPQVETFRRTSIGMCMFYLLPKDSNGQEKSKNGFPVVEIDTARFNAAQVEAAMGQILSETLSGQQPVGWSVWRE